MKMIQKNIAILLLLFATFGFASCGDDNSIDSIIPQIEVNNSTIDVDYNSGKTTIDVTSNVIYFANIMSGKEWLSYEFTDNCKTLTIAYTENKDIDDRVGIIELSKGDKIITLVVTQSGNPDASGPKDTEIAFSIGSAGGGVYQTIVITSDECAKIPIGSTVVFECEGEGSIDGSYTGFSSVNLTVVNGKAELIWTAEIASTASGESGFMAMLWGDAMVTRVFIPASAATKPTKVEVEFNIGSAGGGMYKTVVITSAECAKIPIGSTVVFECEGEGSIDGSYTGFPSVSTTVENGKAKIIWTEDIATAAADETGFMAMLWDEALVTNVYYANPVEVEFSIGSAGDGTYKTVVITSAECAKIPIGNTVVFECDGEGSIDGSYTGFTSVNVTISNGYAEIIWTEEIATMTAGETGFMAMLWDSAVVKKVVYY